MCGQEHIDVDTSQSTSGDNDSLYASGYDTDTTSLITIARNHQFENGRRFHGYKEGKYYLPNDDQEQDRLDLQVSLLQDGLSMAIRTANDSIQHHLFLLTLEGKLYKAPINEINLHRVLDIGTGTGIWCIDMGDEFPSAEVLGIDLSPIQPSWVPPNVRFEIDDIEDEWTWPENYFDYIHLRTMGGFIDDWPKLVRQAYRALRPGGYIEIQDLIDFYRSDDDTVPKNSKLRRWIELIEEGEKVINREWLNVPAVFFAQLKEQGFDDINEIRIKVPNGTWPKDRRLKEMGMFARQSKHDALDGSSMRLFTKALGWEVDAVATFLEEVKMEMFDPKIHAYERIYSIYGRKPET